MIPVRPEVRVCGFAGAGAAGKEPGFSLIKNRNGVQDKKSLLLCGNQEGKTQCMKNIFCMIFIIGINTVEDGGRAVFFYAHFMDSPVSAKDKAVGVGDVKDGKFSGVEQKCTICKMRRFPGYYKNALISYSSFAGEIFKIGIKQIVRAKP